MCRERHRRTAESYGVSFGHLELDRLTERESEVLMALGDGETNRVLARRLGIAERTVKAHLTSVVRKLGLKSRLEATLLSLSLRSCGCAGQERESVGERTAC